MHPTTTPAACDSEDFTVRALLRPAILLLISEQESHGYELIARLTALGIGVPPTSGGMYRCLRAMADEGLLESYWTTPTRGPARRVYALTETGEEQLERSMTGLSQLLPTVKGLLQRYQRA